jgi:hypothetical protein
MLHMAMMNYKNEYGSFPPCFLGLDNSTTDANRVAVRKHLRRLFPRANFDLPGDPPGANPAQSQMLCVPLTINPAAGLVFWLRGFFNDPSYPLSGVPIGSVSGVAPMSRKPLFDFERTRLDPPTFNPLTWNALNPVFQTYRGDGLTMPFVYFDSAHYGLPLTPSYFQSAPELVHVQPYFRDLDNDQVADVTNEGFCNPETFQILCAGRDNKFAPWKGPYEYPYTSFFKNMAIGTTGTAPIALYPTNLYPQDEDNITNFANGSLDEQKP